MQKTNAVLLAVVLALFAYVTLYERFTLSTGETSQRGDRVLPELVRDRLTSITVERGSERFEMVRGPRTEDGSPSFRFSHAQGGSVDAERVLAALTALEWAEPLRTLSRATDDDRIRHGLDRPRLLVRFEVASETTVIAFGGDDASAGGVYADVDGTVYVVGREVFDAFDHDASFFRVRRFAGALPESPSRLVITTERGSVQLARDEDAWRMTQPFEATASEGRVNVVLSFLRTIEATRFVEERPSDLVRYGLATPTTTVTVGDAEHPTAAELRVGGLCGNDTAERYVRFGDGPIVCVANDDLAPLDLDPRGYLELRVLATEAGELRGLDLADGRATLSLAEENGRFQFRLGRESGTADDDSMLSWLDSLRSTRAQEVSPVPAGFSPTLTLTVHETGTHPDDVVHFSVPSSGDVLARRGDDGIVLRFPRSLLEQLSVTTMHVRDLGLIREDPSALEELQIVRRGGTEVLRTSREFGLSIVEPVVAAADATRLADLAARLAGLEAVRFVADAARPEHGLASPRIVVDFVFRRSDGELVRHRLRVGARDDDGTSFALLDDSPMVFALVAATTELLETPIANRDFLQTEGASVDSLEVRVGDRSVRLTREGGRFRIRGRNQDAAAAEAAIRALSELRATEVVDYSAAASSVGLAQPAAEVRIGRNETSPAPREIVLLVGAEQGEGTAGRRAVRRADGRITYWVSSAALEPLLRLAR